MAAVCSMTGFATAQADVAVGHFTVELRCVNSRFLDLSIRVCDDLRFAEQAVRECITKRIARGKFECRIGMQSSSSAAGGHLNTEAFASLRSLQNQVLDHLPQARPLSVNEVLTFPGMLATAPCDREELTAKVVGTLNQALDALIASREREGAALTKVLLGYCDQIEATVNAIGARMPDIVAAVKAKLTERMEEALGEVLAKNSTLSREEVSERIRQEVVLYALKIDVDEEMNRLKTHVAEVRRVLAAGGPVGRRLDFLAQEMNREANTLGSKAGAIEMTQAALALKLSVEQMREQIQNLQ